MARLLGVLLIAVLIVTTVGCANTSIRASGTTVERVFVGDIGLMGEDNQLTLLSGSEVYKLSIMGDNNRVYAERGAFVDKVEIVGEDNIVVVPEGSVLEYSEMGEDNELRYMPEDDD